MDKAFISKTGYQIGDVITLKSEEDTSQADTEDNNNEEDGDV